MKEDLKNDLRIVSEFCLAWVPAGAGIIVYMTHVRPIFDFVHSHTVSAGADLLTWPIVQIGFGGFPIAILGIGMALNKWLWSPSKLKL